MQKILTENELKHVLDSKGFKFGDRFPSTGFVVTFLDKETTAQLSSIVVRDPIDGLSNLPEVSKVKRRNPDQIVVILDFGFDYNTRKVSDLNVELDPYIYFAKKEAAVSAEVNDKKTE